MHMNGEDFVEQLLLVNKGMSGKEMHPYSSHPMPAQKQVCQERGSLLLLTSDGEGVVGSSRKTSSCQHGHG